MSCDADEALLGGAAGPGKTDCLIAYHGARAAMYENARELILRTTYTDLTDVLDRQHAIYAQMGSTWNERERRWHFPSGGTLELGYGSNLKEIARYLGREFTGFGWDEIGELAEEKPYLELSSRIRSTDQRIPLRRRGTANPGGPGHGWLKRRFVERCGKQGRTVYRDPATALTRAYVPGTAKDNPMLPDAYRRSLRALPELRRRQLEEGDWDAAGGMFFEGLNEGVLIVPRLDQPNEAGDRWLNLPKWWTYWGSHDWGFRHWAVTMGFAKDGDGSIFLLDTLWLRRKQDAELGRAIREFFPASVCGLVYAGGDCFAKHQAHGASAETVADVYAPHDVILSRAVLDRVPGWQAMGRVLAPTDANGETTTPILRVCDTPGNRRAVQQWSELVADPNDTRDVLKVDANEEGEGGDDAGDCGRYGIVSPGFVPLEPVAEKPDWTAGKDDDWDVEKGRIERRHGRNVQVFERPSGVDGQVDIASW